MTRVLPESNDYTSRDFDALKARETNGIQSVFPGWTDWQIANFGVIMVEMHCDIGDTVDIYRGNLSREAFLLTAVRRINVQRHAIRQGYTMSGATASQVSLQFTLATTYPGDVAFKTGDIVRSLLATDPARVQLLSDLSIVTGQTQGSVTAEQSVTHVAYFQSDDSQDQEFELPQTPFLSIVSVIDDIGSFSDPVDNFLESTATDPHLMVLVSEDDRALIRFGDDTNGRKPSGEIVVTYKTGGGAVNLEPGTITKPEFTVNDSLGNPVTFTVTNPLAGVPGQNRETNEHAKLQAPASVRVGTRSVAQEDFETNAQRVTGVARALMVTSDQIAGMQENYGQLLLVAKGSAVSSGYFAPTAPTQAQRDEVKALITQTYPPMLTFSFDVIAAPLKIINITARLWLEAGANAAVVDAAIRSAYADFFAVLTDLEVPTTTVLFGIEYLDELGAPDPNIAWSDLFGIVKETNSVRKVDEDAFKFTIAGQDLYDDIPLLSTEFPALGTVALINARTGQALV